jgi:6-phosphogluconolactonase
MFFFAMLFTPETRPAEPDQYLMYVGTYTQGGSRGIYAYRFQPSGGKAGASGLAAETINPSFLAAHPNHQYLYAVNEVSDFGVNSGAVSAFSIDKKTGRLELINKVTSGGRDPCHLTVDRTGKWLVVANYGSGSVSVYPIGKNGEIGRSTARIQHRGSGANPHRQEGPHAHSVNLSPDNRILLVSDLGLDRVMLYRFDAVKGSLAAADPPFFQFSPASGPRHISFHPNGQLLYGINELNSTLTAFAYDSDRGRLRELATVSTLPPDFAGAGGAAEVEAHQDGTFVYASNRGHDSIAVIPIREGGGVSESIEFVATLGRTPRHFAIDPTGNYMLVANQDSDRVVMFSIDRESGTVKPTGTVLNAPMPTCVIFVPQFSA